MNRIFRLLMVFMIGVVALPAVADEDRALEDFYGEFVGRSVAGSTAVTGDEAELTPRHLNVSIHPNDDGFTIAWLTITTRASGKTKAKSYLVDFCSRVSQAARFYLSLDRLASSRYIVAN